MPKCNHCNKKLDFLPFTCKFCHELHCTKHRLPEDHKCIGLMQYKELKEEQFVERAADVVREIERPKKGLAYKIKDFFNKAFKWK
jgi:predicted nucleic acid binding AN1-type Zn finger protein